MLPIAVTDKSRVDRAEPRGIRRTAADAALPQLFTFGAGYASYHKPNIALASSRWDLKL